ncbi:MAG TPA: class I SAM-dependent methyltransferase [Candidatus Omnitrophota bacterium]|nr:class I SAM-dependent methyltransferase [Candidatus Omnitrophota bacterium]
MDRLSINSRMIKLWSERDIRPYKTFSWLSYMAHEILWAKYLFWKDRLNLPANSNVIEVGCGFGKFSILLGLTGEKTTLLDYNKDTLASALELHRWFHLEPRCQTGDLLESNASLRGRFDVACSLGVLEHFAGAQRRRAFQAMADCLRPGGMLFFTVPHRFGFLYRFAFCLRRIAGAIPRSFYEEPYSASELRSIASLSGVDILEVECIGSLKYDWQYWIGENVKSVMRRIFGIKRSGAHVATPDPAETQGGSADLSGSRIKDMRSYWDKRFSSNLLFVGQKK